MARQSELLTAALAATPGDIRRLVGRFHAGVAGLETALAGLVEVERRTRVIIEAALDDGVEGRDHREAQANGAPVSAGHLARRLADERAATLALLGELPVGGWARSVQHPELGEIRVHELVRRLVEHDTGELARLAELASTARSAEGGNR